MIEPNTEERMAALAPSQNVGQAGATRPGMATIGVIPDQNAAPAIGSDLNDEQRKLLAAFPRVSDTSTKTSLLAARAVNPDEAARARNIGSQIGVGTDIALRNMSEVERVAYMQQVDRMQLMARDPALAKFLQDRDNALLAQDDLETLHQTKSLFEGWGIPEGFEAGVQQHRTGFQAGMIKARGNMTAAEIRQIEAWEMNAQAMYESAGGGILPATSRVIGQMYDPFKESLAAGSGAAAMAGGAAAATEIIPPQITMPAAFTAGFTASMMRRSYYEMAGYQYYQMKRDGISEGPAQFWSTVAGAINSSLEMIGMVPVAGDITEAGGKLLFKTGIEELKKRGLLGLAGTATRKTVVATTVEGVTEGGQELINYVTESAGEYFDGRQRITLMTEEGREQMYRDIWANTIEGMYGTFLISAVGPSASFAMDVSRRRKAMAYSQRLEKAIDNAFRSTLRKRNPAAYRELIESRTDATPAANLYVSGAKVDVTLRQMGIQPEQVDGLMPGFSARLREALETGGDVRMSSGEFLAQLATEDVGRALVPHIRVGHPREMSAAQAQEAQAMAASAMRELRDAASKQGQRSSEFVESAGRVEDEVSAMVKETGKFTDEQARYFTDMMVAFVVRGAAETNQTPEQFWAQNRNQILGPNAPMVTQPSTVEQARVPAPDAGVFDANNPPAPLADGQPIVAVLTSDGEVLYDRAATMHGDLAEKFPDKADLIIDGGFIVDGQYQMGQSRGGWSALEGEPDQVALAEELAAKANERRPTVLEQQPVGQAIETGEPGANAPGVGVANENKMGFWPPLRVKITPDRPLPAKPPILTGTTNANASRQLETLNAILELFPGAAESPDVWAQMMAYALGSDDVPVPPYAFIRDINGDGSFNLLSTLTQGQIDDASHGFENAREFRRAYTNGELNVVTTGKLFLWSFLSRGVSPYTQESLFIDAFKGADKWIRKAAAGQFTEADLAEYEEWAKSVAPQGSGQPGAGATHNLNAFGKNFLIKMGAIGEDGKSNLQRLHDMMSDPNQTGKQIRREFAKFGEGVGIDNKVVSFTLLVAGFNDVMVLDRVQVRQLWDDGRFGDTNLYDGENLTRVDLPDGTRQTIRQNEGETDKQFDARAKAEIAALANRLGVDVKSLKAERIKIPGSSLNALTEGVRGILVYEAIERQLAAKISDLYTRLGRPEDGSIGRYHWETWVAFSQQEAAHATIDAILMDAKGDDAAISRVAAKQGEYGAYEYGTQYNRDSQNVPWFRYVTPSGNTYDFSVAAFRQFLSEIKRAANGVVPSKFKVSESGNAPWYTRPEVNQQRLDEQAAKWADRAGGTGEGRRIADAVAADSDAVRQRPGTGAQAEAAPTADSATRLSGADAVRTDRASRVASGGTPGSYERRGGRAYAKPRLVKSLGARAVREYSPLASFRKALEAASTAAKKFASPNFLELEASQQSAEVFHGLISKSKDNNKFGASVFVYPVSDYAGMRLFVAEDGKSGFAIKGDDIVSVFSMSQDSVVHAIMELAVSQGGRRLDAFDTVLPAFYAPHGFRVVSRLNWDESQKPDGWDKDVFAKFNNGEPDVVFMVYDPTYFSAYQRSDGAVAASYDDAVNAQQTAVADVAAGKSLAQAAMPEDGRPRPSEPQGTFDIESFVTKVNAGGNFSTLVHESSHYWLEVMGRLAASVGAPPGIAADFDTILQWFGIEGATPAERLAKWNSMSLAEKEPHHEAWARNMELWVFEGKAPSAELRPAFERFRRWLGQVYISIRDQFNAQYREQFGKDLPIMSPEVQQVFERMFATDEQIARERATREAMALFQTQEESGMNDAEWAAFQAMVLEDDIEAAAEFRKRSMAQLKWLRRARDGRLREMQKDTDKRREEVRGEVEARLREDRVHKARRFLRTGTVMGPDGEEIVVEGHRLNIDGVNRLYELEPEALRPDLSKLGTGAYGMLGKDGMDPNVAAEMLGYRSADEMIRDLIDAPSLEDAVEAETDKAMLAENGELNTPEEREEAIDAALHQEAHTRLIAVQLRLMSKAIQPVRMMVDAARQVARNMLKGKKIRDIRAREYVAAETQAARDAREAWKEFPDPKTAGQSAYTRSMNEQQSAIAAGMAISDAEAVAEQARADATARAQAKIDEFRSKYPAEDPSLIAIAAKRLELLNNQLAREAIAARDEVDKAIARFRKMFGPDERIAKTRNMDRVYAARAILGAFGLGRREAEILKYMEQLRAYDPEIHAELQPMVDAAMAGRMDWRDMTLDQFRSVRDAVESLWADAKSQREITVDGQAVALETALTELEARAEEIGVPEQVPGDAQAASLKERTMRSIMHGKAQARMVESWAEAMDAQREGGPFTKYIWRPIKDAVNRYRVDRNKYVKKFVDLLQGLTLPVGKIVSDELGYTFGAGNGGIGKSEVLGAMMHMGNESNLRKLLLGRGWGELDAEGNLDTSRWDAFVARMFAEGVITKADMDFLQAVWDLNEEIKPLAQRAHKKIFGYYFKEIEAKPVVTPFGTYRGGYVPAKTDPFIVREARQQQAAEQLESDYRYAMPSTGDGFRFSRVDYNKALSLDIRMMAAHIDSVIRFAHIQPAVKDVLKVIRNREFADMLTRMDPAAIEDMLIPWLNRAARQVTTEPGRYAPADRFWKSLRQRSGMNIMFANISNTMQQLTGLMIGMVKVKGMYIRGAMVAYAKSPRETANMVAAASPFMDDRMRSQIFQLQEDMNDILLNPSAYGKMQAWAKKHAYFAQQAYQNVVDIIVWTGAYNQALAEAKLGLPADKAHAEAVQRADSAVRLTQSSLSPEDVSRIAAGTPFFQTFVQFTNYFNMLANLNATEYTVIFRDLGWRNAKGRLFMTYLLGYAMPMIVSDAIAKTFRGQWDDEDDDGYLDEVIDTIFGSQVRGAVALLPFGPAAYVAISAGFTSKTYDDRIMTSPSVSTLESSTIGVAKAFKAAVDPETDVSSKNVRDVLTAVSWITGIPVQAMARPILYIRQVINGDVEPTGPIDFVRGVLTGTASEASKNR